MSPASPLRLKAQWQGEYETWKRRRLDDLNWTTRDSYTSSRAVDLSSVRPEYPIARDARIEPHKNGAVARMQSGILRSPLPDSAEPVLSEVEGLHPGYASHDRFVHEQRSAAKSKANGLAARVLFDFAARGTSNVVESLFATVRPRTTAAKRFKKVEHATALIWKILQVAASTFRRLKGAELLPAVYAGARTPRTGACRLRSGKT